MVSCFSRCLLLEIEFDLRLIVVLVDIFNLGFKVLQQTYRARTREFHVDTQPFSKERVARGFRT